MNGKDFSKLKKGDTVIYQGDRLTDYKGCDAEVITIDRKNGIATVKLPDEHVAFVDKNQIEAQS